MRHNYDFQELRELVEFLLYYLIMCAPVLSGADADTYIADCNYN